VFCGVGFLLSFLIGLISGNPFLTVLIRAFVSCLCFGVIAAAISFAYNRFLNVQISEVSEIAPAASSVDAAFVPDDEALTEDNGPGFYVDESSKVRPYKSMSSGEAGPVKQYETEEAASGANSGSFNPASGKSGDSLDTLSDVPESSVSFQKKQNDSIVRENASVTPQTSGASTAKNFTDELDELPEISSHEQMPDSESVETIIDTDDGGTTTQFVPAGLEEIASSNDASVMASAIRTVLSSDN
jgi:hypothetical protein